ncbi:kinase-like domain-containing protein [Crucibulum laeve]|uniref:Kinase-like domain-containing protein n=1 Tax=Crucibulum laeve TaxID=68775 RepID=A0A5C3M1D8_9AGAR|nr:kinase-like domain-containing protein [Crucibulum laeve]
MEVLNAEIQLIDHHHQMGGAYANVWRGQYMAQDNSSIQLVAVKVPRGACIQYHGVQREHAKNLIECFVAKAKAWSDLSHPHIVEILGVFTDTTITGTPGVVTYYRPLGNIANFLRDRHAVNKLVLVKGIAEGANYLHLKHIIHGNLTRGNILIHQEGEEFIPQIAYCTFTRTDEVSTTDTILFTVSRRTPPELLGAENPTTAMLSRETDIYAFAMLALEVVTGKPPFYNCTDLHAALLVAGGSMPLRHQYASYAEFSDAFWGLLERCWNANPLDRLTMDEVCRLL